jgi:tRNA-modifying protein YgfZ
MPTTPATISPPATPAPTPGTAATLVVLDDRGLVRVNGGDARKLLNGLVTNDLDKLDRQPAIFAGLLSPQGKILFDFFVIKAGTDTLLLDVARSSIEALVKRLTMYKLRAAVTIDALPAGTEHDPAALVVAAMWGGSVAVPAGVVAYPDPRLAALGQRLVTPRGRIGEIAARPGDAAAYHAHRIACGVPEGGRDYGFAEAFPHEALFDQLDGVDFGKGCYVGQEVVSRMEHRGMARNRIVQIEAVAGGQLAAGGAVQAGELGIGQIGSVAGPIGLALIRLDRAHEATLKGQALTTGTGGVVLHKPAWATFDMTGAKRAEPA